jgi:hypothetical protein
VRWTLAAAVLLAAFLGLASSWLPWVGLTLIDQDALQPADVIVLLDGSGARAMDGVEQWRQRGLARDVVIVEAPLRTHAFQAYWTDFVAWGLARPSPTPPEHLRVARSATGDPGDQLRASVPPIQALGARSVLLVGNAMRSRLERRMAEGVYDPAGIQVRISALEPPTRDPARWFEYADDRRAVLSMWIQLLVPFAAA